MGSVKETEMWEILVPTISNDGKPFRTKYHKVWDKMVYEITDGITILTPSKGKWVNANGRLFEERMIPVRISCTEKQINKIVDFTIKYYDQEAVMAYRIADKVILKYK